MLEFFQVLERHVAISGERRAIVAPGGDLTYRELLERVRRSAQWAGRLPDRVGVQFGKSPEGIISDLALSYAGKELVPLPTFFSDSQLSHIIGAAQLTHAVCSPDLGPRLRTLGLAVAELGAETAPNLLPAASAARIIFTSGTTGRPKGVRISSRQMLASIAALARATGANATDRYLSLLPNSLLLEQIAGIYVPLWTGAEIHLPRVAPDGSLTESIAQAAERAQPTASVLVPELLAAWLRDLNGTGRLAPPSLRYVAVGGASVPTRLAGAAMEHGIPIYEGYGLSECCSVVCVNRPGERRAGSVGRPLPGVQVAIENGEIVVSGPTVMDGYVNDREVGGAWRTGDIGGFDPDGYLVVAGRKDNVIVTGAGRNVQPEWIEETIAGDRRIRRCVVVEHESALVGVVIPEDAAMCADWPTLQSALREAVRHLPEYARPERYLALSEQDCRRHDLLTANHRPQRSAIRRYVAERSLDSISRPA